MNLVAQFINNTSTTSEVLAPETKLATTDNRSNGSTTFLGI
jgi:hypothetical protein